MDSLLQATLPPGPVEDEVDSYEAFVPAGRVSELSNAATPKQDAVVLVLATPSNAAKPLIAFPRRRMLLSLLLQHGWRPAGHPSMKPSLLLWEIG